MEFKHIPILFHECMDLLAVKADGIYVDGTLGGGGHSSGICQRLTTGRLIGIDRDREAIAAAGTRLEPYSDRTILIQDNYSNIKQILTNLQIAKIDGALLDLGVSSYQLDNPERGFSYMQDAPLDMRMNREDSLSAYQVINTYPEPELARIIKEYGEEKWAARIAKFIAEGRQAAPIETTFQLNDRINRAIPAKARKEGGHPSKRTFQAIRIEVNGELKKLEQALEDFFDCLNPGGVLAVITFHSLEDRIVKQLFQNWAQGCTCPKDFPVCVCGNKPKGNILTKKPIIADAEETERNSRSKSAKLRGIQKL